MKERIKGRKEYLPKNAKDVGVNARSGHAKDKGISRHNEDKSWDNQCVVPISIVRNATKRRRLTRSKGLPVLIVYQERVRN